jgi:nucleoside-diphosphate-sugar epimerase
MLTLVIGTGYTGGRVLKRLHGAFGLSKSPPESGKESASFDLDTATSLPIDLPDAYKVIYTVPPAGESTDSGDDRLQRLLALLDPEPQSFVYISTTGVYGDCGGAKIDESAAVNPGTLRARRRVAAERQLSEWAAASESRLTILRTPGIYGPGRLGEARLHNEDPVLSEADANPGNRIHVDDLASCCCAALDAPAGIYNVGDGDHRSATWFISEVARQLGFPEPRQLRREELARNISPLRLSFLSESRHVDTRKMRAQLGFIPTYTNAADGIRASHQKSGQP